MRLILYQSFCNYMQRSPAFLLSIAALFGVAFSHSLSCLFLVMTAAMASVFFLHPFERKKRAAFVICLSFVCAGGYSELIKMWRGQIKTRQEGMCLFHIEDIALQKTPFKNHYIFKGKIETLTTAEGKIFRHIPCKIFPPKGSKEMGKYRNIGFFATVSLQEGAVIVEPQGPWTAMGSKGSIAYLRYSCKQKIRKFLYKKMASKKGASFLYSLLCGEIETQLLERDFARLGLQHVLAVSGFHFGIIALFLSTSLRCFVARRPLSILLVLFLSVYFFLLSSSASVFRAYLTFCIATASSLFERRSDALNTLGHCLICQLLIDPRIIFHIGFQLSYLCTLSLLLLNPTVLRWSERILPPQLPPQKKIASATGALWPLMQNHLRKAITTSLSVHMVSVPVCLYAMKSFPLFSLLYNLFFPTLITLCMALFLFSLSLMIIPPIGSLLLSLTGSLTACVLKLTEHPPTFLEYTLWTQGLYGTGVILYLATLFYFFSYQQTRWALR